MLHLAADKSRSVNHCMLHSPAITAPQGLD